MTIDLQEYEPLIRQLAAKVARSTRNAHQAEDFYGVGWVGLRQAEERFDPTRGVPFGPFARQRIHGAMLDYLRSTDWVPRGERKRATETGKAVVSLGTFTDHSTPNDDGDEVGLEGETSSDERPDEIAAVADQANLIRKALGRMKSRDAKFLRLRFLEGKTLREVGAAIGVTESRASQLESSILLAARAQFSRKTTPQRRLPWRSRPGRFTDEQRRQIVSDYFDSDLTMQAVGTKWNLTTTSVYYIVAGPIAIRLFGKEQAQLNAERTLRKRADRLARSKRRISLEDVKTLRDQFRSGNVRVVDLARKHGVRRETMGCIIYGRQVYGRGVYATLDPVPAPGGKRKLTFEQAQEIRERYSTGDATAYDLAAAYGVSYSAITCVLHGKSYQCIPGKPGQRGVNAPSAVAAMNSKLGIEHVTPRSASAHRRWRRQRHSPPARS